MKRSNLGHASGINSTLACVFLGGFAMSTKLPFLSDDHHFAIANVAVRVGQMEWHIENLIHNALFKQPKTAEVALKNLGADRLVTFVSAVLHDSFPEFTAEIDSLESEINRIKTERNEILHWIWGKSEKPETAIHISARPFRAHLQKKKTALDIQKVADDALEAVKAIVWWSNHIQQLALVPLTTPPSSSRGILAPQSPPEHSLSPSIPDLPSKPPLLGPQLRKPQG
jgi:hypothetical protein